MSYIFHGLNERHRASVRFPSFFLQMLIQGGLVVYVVAGPEAEHEGPGNRKFGPSAPNVRILVKQF